MAVFRVEKSKDYTVMSNHHLRDNSLSLKAKGLLSQMLSLPEGWDYTLLGLSQINKESKDAIRAAVNELEAAGYIQRHQTTDGNGKFAGNEYIIHEVPVLPSPSSGFPTTENPSTEKPSSENPTELNIDISSKDISEKKKKEKSSKGSYDPTPAFAYFVRSVAANHPHESRLYETLKNFAVYRMDNKKPIQSEQTVNVLCNRLRAYGGNDIGLMIELLETAISSGWRTVFPPKNKSPVTQSPVKTGGDKEWL